MNLTEKKIQESIITLKDWVEKPDAKNEKYVSIINEIAEKIETNTVTKDIFRTIWMFWIE